MWISKCLVHRKDCGQYSQGHVRFIVRLAAFQPFAFQQAHIAGYTRTNVEGSGILTEALDASVERMEVGENRAGVVSDGDWESGSGGCHHEEEIPLG